MLLLLLMSIIINSGSFIEASSDLNNEIGIGMKKIYQQKVNSESFDKSDVMNLVTITPNDIRYKLTPKQGQFDDILILTHDMMQRKSHLELQALVGVVPNVQLQALKDLYDAFGGAIPWTFNATLANNNPCTNTWRGISCVCDGSTCDISQILLPQISLSISPTIPSSLSVLTKLQYLQLNNNKLVSSIPSTLSTLTALVQLNLANNQLTSSIPSSLSTLTHLQYLLLQNNQLTSSIPFSLSTLSNLWVLDISNNAL